LTSNIVVPVRVQRKRTKGFNLQKASPNGLPVVYCGRPTKWGNPYKVPKGIIGEEKDREIALQAILLAYEKWLRAKLEEDPYFLDPLKGKNLACFCPLTSPCHCDIILKIMKELENEADKEHNCFDHYCSY